MTTRGSDDVARAGRGRKWIALALLAYVLAARYDRTRGTAGAWLARAGLTAQRAEVEGRALRYVRAGSGAPVVPIHGFASSIYTWSEVLPALARRHDVLALDLPRFGGSDLPPSLAWPGLPRAVLGLMDRLGLPKATIVGHSLGGAVPYLVAPAQGAGSAPRLEQHMVDVPVPPEAAAWLVAEWRECVMGVATHRAPPWRPVQARRILDGLAATEDPNVAERILRRATPGSSTCPCCRWPTKRVTSTDSPAGRSRRQCPPVPCHGKARFTWPWRRPSRIA
jgi:pimeloyl-ACP methyl ester carboxylesterase